jgi:G3E family GTPase
VRLCTFVEEKMVFSALSPNTANLLQNGCICCTLREDLIEEVGRLAKMGRFEYLIIESTGISEPMQVHAHHLHLHFCRPEKACSIEYVDVTCR